MKKLTTFLMMVSFLLLMVALVPSCKDDYPDLLRNKEVNREFEWGSPYTDQVTLQLLEKPNKWGNFLMTANLKGQLKDEYLAYEVDDQKVVLRDDGKGADSVKGDGIFSVYVQMDTSEVKGMVQEQNATIARTERLEASRSSALKQFRFDRQDTASFASMHSLVQSDPNFIFENRQLKFNKRIVPAMDIDAALKRRLPIPIFPTFACLPPPSDLIEKSLMINDLSVVEDPARTWNPVTHTGNKNGAWTFNNIINQIVNKASTGMTATDFVLKWLQTWDNPIPLNGDVADARNGVDQIISNWKQRSLANGLPADTLDMAEAPVRLLAIVNRIDLRGNTGYGSTNAGEGRFVFCVMNSTPAAVINIPKRFTIIFEYGVNRVGCRKVQNWGQQWYNLHNLSFGDPAYNKALQAITDQFVNANTTPSKPNGSSLNQLRTDELDLGNPWQLREFNIDAASHLLKLVTVKKTPRDNLNNTTLLADFINANCTSILANNFNVPETFSGQPILGAKSNNIPAPAWNAAITCTDPQEARRIFSLNTCNACHGVETATGFTHVKQEQFGLKAPLSDFLTGENIDDPVSLTPVTYTDLDDRAKKLQNLVCQLCKIFGPLVLKPLNMTH